jgi:hypothetical protein
VRIDPDKIHRTEWHAQPIRGHAPVTAVRAGPVTTSRATVERKPSVASADTRISQWQERLQDRVDDEAENGEELSAVELVAEAVGLLQNATDTALAVVDRQAGEARAETQGELTALRKRVNDLEEARRADADKHQRELAKLLKRLEAFETKTGEQVDRVHAALRVEAADAAEARSVARLQMSSRGKLHRARVQQRMAVKELEGVGP